MRATLKFLENGSYHFRTVKPKNYPIPVHDPLGKLLNKLDRQPFKPAQIHFMVKAESYVDLITYVFLDGDKCLQSDNVFTFKKSLIKKNIYKEKGSNNKCLHINFDVVMENYREIFLTHISL